MPSLKDIRRRITSVKNTQKITKSMKMVSAAKLRRAEDAARRSRPYASELNGILGQLLAGVDEEAHPLLAQRPIAKTAWVVVTSDRGLCGGFNSSLLRMVEREVRDEIERKLEPGIWVVGKKAREYFVRRQFTIRGEMIGVAAAPTSADAARIAAGAIKLFTSGEVDEVAIVYNEFVSALVQRPKIQRVLPLAAPREAEGGAKGKEGGATEALEPLFEPSRETMLSVLLPRVVENRIYHALLESAAAEHAARMAAMEAATSNATEMIDSLTLQFNKARQAAITKELMEIVGGAEALASA